MPNTAPWMARLPNWFVATNAAEVWPVQARKVALFCSIVSLIAALMLTAFFPGVPGWAVALVGASAAALCTSQLIHRFLIVPLNAHLLELETELATAKTSTHIVKNDRNSQDAETIKALVSDNQQLIETLERDRARASISTSQISAIFDNSHDPLVLTDAAGIITLISDSAATLLGMPRSSATGTDFEEAAELFDAEKENSREYRIRGFVRRVLESQSSIPLILPAKVVQLGELISVLITACGVRSPSGEVHGVLIRVDPSDSSVMARASGRWSQKDPYTDLLTKEVFAARADELIEISRIQNAAHALLLIAVDDLSGISQRHGHSAADEALWGVARLLHEEIATAGDCYRISADHFAALIAFAKPEQAKALAERTRDRVDANEFVWFSTRFDVTVSVSVVMFDYETMSRTTALESANQGLIKARSLGGNSVVFEQAGEIEVQRRRDDRAWIEWLLPRMEGLQSHLISQGIAMLPRKPQPETMLEILLRVEDDDGAWLAPGSFMPSVERHNLTAKMDEMVLRKMLVAFDTNANLRAHCECASVNLSGSSLLDPEFAKSVERMLKASPDNAKRVAFEIDELFASTHVQETERFIQAVRPTGARIALDRCRTPVPPGALRRLEVDWVKLHEALIRRMLVDNMDAAQLQWMVQANHMLGRKVIATGVESEETLNALELMGVDMAQGVYINKMGPLIS